MISGSESAFHPLEGMATPSSGSTGAEQADFSAAISRMGGGAVQETALHLAIAIGADPTALAKLRQEPGATLTRDGFSFKLAPDGTAADGKPNAFRIDVTGRGVEQPRSDGTTAPLRYTLPSAPVAIVSAVNAWRPAAGDAEKAQLFESFSENPTLGQAFLHYCIKDEPPVTLDALKKFTSLTPEGRGWSRELAYTKVRDLFEGASVESLKNDRPIQEFPLDMGGDAVAKRGRTSDAISAQLLDPSVNTVRVAMQADLNSVADGDRFPQKTYMPHALRDWTISRQPDSTGIYTITDRSATDVLNMQSGFHHRAASAPYGSPWTYVPPNQKSIVPEGSVVRLPDTNFHNDFTARYQEILTEKGPPPSAQDQRYFEFRLPGAKDLTQAVRAEAA